MCGIAGLIHRKGTSNVGQEMTSMLQALKHRGPDSTGFAMYGDAGARHSYCASRWPSRKTCMVL